MTYPLFQTTGLLNFTIKGYYKWPQGWNVIFCCFQPHTMVSLEFNVLGCYSRRLTRLTEETPSKNLKHWQKHLKIHSATVDGTPIRYDIFSWHCIERVTLTFLLMIQKNLYFLLLFFSFTKHTEKKVNKHFPKIIILIAITTETPLTVNIYAKLLFLFIF